MIEKVAVLRQSQKRCAVNNFAKGLIQKIIGEEGARVSDDDRLTAIAWQAQKLLAQVRMHDEKGCKLLLREKIARQSRGRKDVLHRDVDADFSKIGDNSAPGAAGRVGDEFQRNACLPDSLNRVERARQSRLADVHDTIEVEEDAFGRRIHKLSCGHTAFQGRLLPVAPIMERAQPNRNIVDTASAYSLCSGQS